MGAPTFGNSTAITIGLASLPSDHTNEIAGRESTCFDLRSHRDAILGGKITVGSTITINRIIEVWLYGSYEDTPLFPDGITGVDANKTMTSKAIKTGCLNFYAALGIDSTTADRPYWLPTRSIASCFGGVCPKWAGLFVMQTSGSNLNSTAGNHTLYWTGVR